MADNVTLYLDKAEIALEVTGEILNQAIACAPAEMTISVQGSIIVGILIECSFAEITISVKGTVLIESVGISWVKWSKIGTLDFTIDQSNVAGERPLDWYGTIYHNLKLGKNVVIYGANGVSLMTPVGTSMGLQTISRIGIKNKGAVVGTDTEHFFIDKKYRLCKMSDQGLEILDYSEYLGQLTGANGIVLSLDLEYGLLFICDGLLGFVYSTQSKSLGQGPENVTGVGTKNGTQYVVAPDEIVTPKFEICTDIYDLGIRKPKTVQMIEVGTNLTEGLEALIETRNHNNDEFIKSSWIKVNPSGIAYIPCFGTEFKFRLRSLIYEYFEIDYVKIIGSVHGANYLDQQQ